MEEIPGVHTCSRRFCDAESTRTRSGCRPLSALLFTEATGRLRRAGSEVKLPHVSRACRGGPVGCREPSVPGLHSSSQVLLPSRGDSRTSGLLLACVWWERAPSRSHTVALATAGVAECALDPPPSGHGAETGSPFLALPHWMGVIFSDTAPQQKAAGGAGAGLAAHGRVTAGSRPPRARTQVAGVTPSLVGAHVGGTHQRVSLSWLFLSPPPTPFHPLQKNQWKHPQ